ncbi:MAG: lytic transglycosylase domain-containing protein [Alphaproteobacteria bacterium]|nr:lytic transglycosylase domain-containing protein [Alphaproteobacteria bacterium]
MKSWAVAIVMAAALGAATPACADRLSASDAALYRQAFSAASGSRYEQALAMAQGAREKLPAKVLRWLVLQQPGGNATFAEISGFLDENPDWPAQAVMRRRAEEAITLGTPPEALLAWFERMPPVSGAGMTAHARALRQMGRETDALAAARHAWRKGEFGSTQEKTFLAEFGPQLRREDHEARLDEILWDGEAVSARRMLDLVDDAHRHLAEARIALMSGAAGVEGLIDRVPHSLENDPGLIFERLRWRRRKDMDDAAIELFDHESANKGRPELWWAERGILARRALQRGRVSAAYEIAKGHALKEGAEFAEAEWLAGWIALRFLGEREMALEHFRRLHQGVVTPMSKARGAYWAGRAAEALNDEKASTVWYERAAVHGTTYYGQLAAGRLKREPSLPADPVPTAEDVARFDASELARAVRLMSDIGATDQVRPFLLRLNDIAKTPGERALAAALGAGMGRHDLALVVSKRADREGVTLVRTGWPVPSSYSLADQPEKALLLAVIRQESAFQPEVVSSAGARGLMQLMPATAKKVASGLKMNYSPSRLVTDPHYNMRLGTAYLGEVLDSFSGSYVLAIAAYNAGPARVRKWLREYGDPRNAGTDVVDWVESIPFTETRNYVQRVIENVQVYRRRLGRDRLPSIEEDLAR